MSDNNYQAIPSTKIQSILSMFGISAPDNIQQIYRSAWNIDDKFILKTSTKIEQLEKSIMLCDLLIKEGISVSECIRTPEGKPFVQIDESHYVLMKKLGGGYLDPYSGTPYKNGVLFGSLIAKLHIALKKIGDNFDYYDADSIKELDDWIMKNIREKDVSVPKEVVEYCYDFGTLYKTLPRQLIHRDTHNANILFENGAFSGWLDFDISQKNVRLFDVCYFGAATLVANYKDKSRFLIWNDIFRGVLNGYQSVSPLTKNELNAIPYMFVLIEIIFTSFYAGMNEADSTVSCVDMTVWLYNTETELPIL